jgi:hypothetical protein
MYRRACGATSQRSPSSAWGSAALRRVLPSNRVATYRATDALYDLQISWNPRDAAFLRDSPALLTSRAVARSAPGEGDARMVWLVAGRLPGG